jgi:hypothetical protein
MPTDSRSRITVTSSMTALPLTKHAPLLGAGATIAGGRDLYKRQQAALAAAQRVPGVGSADDVRQAVSAYLHHIARDELADVTSTLNDVLTLLDDAAATAHHRSTETDTAAGWRAIARAIEDVRRQAEQLEAQGDDDGR